MIQFYPIFIFFQLFALLNAQITCPNNEFTLNSNAGTIPAGATGLTTFPSNFNCTYTFDIPNGYFVDFVFNKNFDPHLSGNSIIIVNAVDEKYSLSSNSAIYKAPSRTASIIIKTKTDDAQIFIDFSYKSLSNNVKISKKTGEYISLNFPTDTFYSFSSPVKNPVKIDVSSESEVHKELVNYYVYYGQDLNSTFWGGSLAYLIYTVKRDIIGLNGLSIVNLYPQKSNLYLLANDYQQVEMFNVYRVKTLNSSMAVRGQITSLSTKSSAFTFICTDCSEMFITDLVFKTTNSLSNVIFYPMSPSSYSKSLFSSSPSSYRSSNFPQQIPGSMFTFVVQQSSISIKIDPNAQDEWSKIYEGRRIVIFSPSLWDPARNGSFAYKFSNEKLYTFVVQVLSLNIFGGDGYLSTIVGSDNNPNLALNDCYNVSTTQKLPAKAANGTYSSLNFIGKNSADFAIIQLNVDSTNPTTTTTTTTQTITTKMSPTRTSMGGISMILMMVKMMI